MMRRSNTRDVFERIVEQIDEPDSDIVDSSAEISGASADAADGKENTAAKSGDTAKAVEHDVDADEGEGADTRPARPRLRRLWRRTAFSSAIAIFVAALTTSGFLFWQLEQTRAEAAAGEAALNTAKSYAVTLSSVDTKDIDKNFAQVLDGATGEFKDMYSQSSAQLRQLLIDNKAVSHGVVIDAGIKSATKSKVEVMLFLDQSISNEVTPEPRIDRLRMMMTLDLIDGRWLASRIEIS